MPEADRKLFLLSLNKKSELDLTINSKKQSSRLVVVDQELKDEVL